MLTTQIGTLTVIRLEVTRLLLESCDYYGVSKKDKFKNYNEHQFQVVLIYGLITDFSNNNKNKSTD